MPLLTLAALVSALNRAEREWTLREKIFGDPVAATALLDRLLHHAVVARVEGTGHRLRQHAELVHKHICSNALIQPGPHRPAAQAGPAKENGGADPNLGRSPQPATCGIFKAHF